MIKRTLFFGNPVYLSTAYEQLKISFPDENEEPKTIPIEDVGVIVLESQQITLTNALLNKLSENKAVVISCNKQHLPIAIMLPTQAHTEYTERLKHQLNAGKPLKKRLWAQTVKAKISNQSALLAERGKANQRLEYLANKVQSGDVGNQEAIAAAYYWQHLFNIEGFNRTQHGIPPNNLLNYGYAILRAMMARAIVSAGMLTALGIWHSNKYNAYCLADDLMEPYRPYIDLVVSHLVDNEDDITELNTTLKAELLRTASLDVVIDGKRSPLMVAINRTATSLYDCYSGKGEKLIYPKYA